MRTTTRALAAACLATALAVFQLIPVTPATLATPLATAQTLSAASSVNPPLDELGRPTPDVIRHVNAFADKPYVPDRVGNALRTAVNFYGGTGELGGPPLPADAPPFTQFYWPTVSSNCIGPGLHSTASAIAVPGPATSPAPGAAPGQATFVFTALGTPAAAPQQGLMRVYWFNTSNFRSGVTLLGNNGINPTGPATLSATAATGPGNVIAVVDGGVRTLDKVCNFAPTAASFHVR